MSMTRQVMEHEIDRLKAEVEELKCERDEYRSRLQIDPGGSDKIDELEQAMQFQKSECEELKARAEKAESWIKSFLGVTDFGDDMDSIDPVETGGTVNQWQCWAGKAEKAEAALAKIDAIRNSIVGTQTVNWSAHIYPLVAALEEAGIHGQGYEQARTEAATLLDRAKKAEARLAELARNYEIQVDFGAKTASKLRARAERAEAKRNEVIGIVGNMDDGPYAHCTDCGRRMVWNDPDREMPVWMCPRCVFRRMVEAEADNARLRASRHAWKVRLRSAAQARDYWHYNYMGGTNRRDDEVARLTADVERLRSLLRKAKDFIPTPASCERQETAEYLEWLHRAIEEAVAPIDGVVTATDALRSVIEERGREVARLTSEVERLWACVEMRDHGDIWCSEEEDMIKARDLSALEKALGIAGGK